jgi:hypothetical protein
MSDIRASELEEGMRYREYGMDDAVTIKVIDWHGDTVLITSTDGMELTLDRDTVVERVKTTVTPPPAVPDFSKDVPGQSFGGAYWSEADYRVTLKVSQWQEHMGLMVVDTLLLEIEDSLGTKLFDCVFSDVQGDRLRDLARTSEEADDEGLGLSRELHWRFTDNNNQVDLNVNVLEEIAAWLDFVFRDEVYDGNPDEWEY